MEKAVTIAFYSPYIADHLGGGEKHLLDVALVCQKYGHNVSLCVPMHFTDDDIASLQRRLQAVFGGDLSGFNWIRSPLYNHHFSFKKLFWTRQFDFLYFVTDGSLFFSLAKKNILHIQIPFTTKLSGVLNRLKLRNWQLIQTNSQFTKRVIEKHWSCTVDQVLYPKVDETLFQLHPNKKNIILSVGRFFRQLHSKRQDILVKAFASLLKKREEAAGWELVLLGSVEDEGYFSEVRRAAAGLPVTFVTNASRNDVVRWYQKARLYWHATGFEQNSGVHPERVEHFGISTVEAMASGSVPLAVGKGGQKEILSGELADLQWQTIDELVSKTSILLRSSEYYQKFQTLSKERARDFDATHFEKAVAQLFGWKEDQS